MVKPCLQLLLWYYVIGTTMKVFKDKKILIIFLVLFGLFFLTFVLFTKNHSEGIEKDIKKKEIAETKEYLFTFPDREFDSPDSVTTDDLLDIVLSEIMSGGYVPFCGLKEDGTKYEVMGREGYSDFSQYFDLNSDGIEEFLVYPIEVCKNIIRGASGNGPIYIFQIKDDTWVNIGELNGNRLSVGMEKKNGYYILETNYHMSAKSGITYLYEYVLTDTDDGKGMYREVSESEYDDSKTEN